MASRKQWLYCRFLEMGISRLRVLCGIAEGCSEAELLDMSESFRDRFDVANLLHNIHGSILKPDYVDNDIRFINWEFRSLSRLRATD
ncbi:MAG TPA: hypothetical protein VFT74_04830 [Isosphaeraceae bacterium]|nr:hypothetical protein [Isosphaeraceae bacterium]